MTRGEFWRWFTLRLLFHLALTVFAVYLIIELIG